MKAKRLYLKLSCLALSSFLSIHGQHHHQRFEALDVLNYKFELDLNDSSDVIIGHAQVDIQFRKDVEQFYLDLKDKGTEETGMVVDQLTEGGSKVKFIHQDDRLVLSIPHTKKGSVRKFLIEYHGIPEDGLIISKNKFGDRTFFGDNWPDRARHWLPVVDHPSDKALVEFIIHAPNHYGVVANGFQISEVRYDGRVCSQWKTDVPLPTKLMVIGVSPFAIQHFFSSSGVPVSTYVYPQNKEAGFYDYRIATQSLDFFETYIAPYPYSKLANVQSKTVYGGMENASCIFYREGTVTGERKNETLFAHEIAHQWFGDAVTELNWYHIWISEGFATYLTDIYLEQVHDRNTFVASLIDERNKVIRYSRRRIAPIVDTTLSVSTRLLNNNSYDKAGWVLHMLRKEVGDQQFQQCVQEFYEVYKFKNALTDDFQEVVEKVTGKDFTSFFNQWFHGAGHPVLSYDWSFSHGEIYLTIKQHQESQVFEFPLDIQINTKKHGSIQETLSIHAPEQTFSFKSKSKPSTILLDPDTWLLFEAH